MLKPLFTSLLLALLCGCYSREITVHLDDDGSGLLEIRTTVSQAGLDYGRHHEHLPAEQLWFNEQSLRRSAVLFGQGVHYLNHRSGDIPGGREFVVTYQFEDLSGLLLRVDIKNPFFLAQINEPMVTDTLPTFRFERSGNTIRIHPPAKPAVRPSPPHVVVEGPRVQQQREQRLLQGRARWMSDGNPFRLTGRETAGELIRHIAGDMHFRVQIRLPQEPRFHTASHLQGLRLTLFELDAQQALDSPELLKRIMEGQAASLTWETIITAPGVLSESGDAVLIQFREPSVR